jgi:hypothetical protein
MSIILSWLQKRIKHWLPCWLLTYLPQFMMPIQIPAFCIEKVTKKPTLKSRFFCRYVLKNLFPAVPTGIETATK